MITRRTLTKSVAVLCTVLMAPFASATSAHSKPRVPVQPSQETFDTPDTTSLREYMLFAIPEALENQINLWFCLTPEESWDLVRKYGVYDPESKLWWVKSASTHIAEVVPLEGKPVRFGITTLALASYYAGHYRHGHVEVLKNKLSGVVTAPEVLHSPLTATLVYKKDYIASEYRPSYVARVEAHYI